MIQLTSKTTKKPIHINANQIVLVEDTPEGVLLLVNNHDDCIYVTEHIERVLAKIHIVLRG